MVLPKQVKYSLFVLIGACSYGIHASTVKLTFGAGHSIDEVTGGQYFFGIIMLLLLLTFSKKQKLSLKSNLNLMGIGVFLSFTGIFYSLSIERLPASIAIVLLFQFTWIGVLLDAIASKKWPSKQKLVSVVLLWLGTIFAAGIFEANGFQWSQSLDGVMYGFFASITFALFIFFSGKVAKNAPTIQRSIMIAIGGILVIIALFRPTFVWDGTLTESLWSYGLVLGLFGTIFPIIFFSLGTPHIDSGLATIAGAAELPAAIVAAMFILGEVITLAQGFGMMLILVGIILPQLPTHTRHRKRSEPIEL
ncbi:EamA family transporter [Jeotgalibacillus marinus]|uniref:DMT family transporter n=1 Tax=Jeotgalibacillus marinus TaxID=86667 RepID=A0ABV3Q1T6_9BACL